MEIKSVVFAAAIFLTCYMIGYFTCLSNNRKLMTKEHRLLDALSELVANFIILSVGVTVCWSIITLVDML